jgi:hypothetical protein
MLSTELLTLAIGAFTSKMPPELLPNLYALREPRPFTQADAERLARAEAKRVRRANKRLSKT